MTPVYLNSQPPSPFPLEYDDHEDDHHHHELLMISPKSQASSYSSSSSPSLSCTMLSNNPSLDQGGGYHHGEIQLLGHQHEADTFVSHGGSYDHTIVLENERDKYGLKLPIWKKKAKTSHEDQNENDDSGSAKWMSSKMRLVRKMINGGTDRSAADAQINTTSMFGGHHKQLISSSSPFETDYNSNNNNNTIRVCSDCNTTKTPLWRTGPRGPKTLCNACGIRQRKARRAMAAAAAAAAANGTILATSTTSHVKTKVQHKDKKKRSKKLAAAPSSTAGLSQKLCFEDFTLSLSEKYSAFQRVFPQDEKEAAILLMALSCGLVS